MATEDNALTPQEQAKLKAFAQGLPDEPGEIDVDAIAQETGTSRRQVLQIIAAVGVGSIAGGVSVSQLVSEAQAQASTSDSDGNVGTPSDRVDVFADGVDASVIDTENINISEIGQYISASDTNGSVEFASGTTEIEGDNNSNFIENPDYGIFIVTGTLQGAESNRFLDIVLHVGASSPTVVDSNQNASPGSRTYSSSGFQFLIAIDDSGEVYDVQYFQLSSGP